MPHEAPAIVRLAERVLVEIENAVRAFPRFHKYAIGNELRSQARDTARWAHRAWRDRARRGEWLNRLVFAIDDLKVTMQVANTIQAFPSFRLFESLARLISDLGRQCGGWQREHLKGQNSRTAESAGRAQILSARDASHGANP